MKNDDHDDVADDDDCDDEYDDGAHVNDYVPIESCDKEEKHEDDEDDDDDDEEGQDVQHLESEDHLAKCYEEEQEY